MLGIHEQSLPVPLHSVRQFYMKLLHPCQLSFFHTHLYIALSFGPALPSILRHPVPIRPPNSYECLPDCVFELFPCTKIPSAQCIKMTLTVERLLQLALGNVVTQLIHVLFRNYFISLISLICVSFSIFEVG